MNRIFSLLTFQKKNSVSLLFVGLDFSGKSSIINFLKPKPERTSILPTVGYSVETIKMDNLKLTIFDLSGQGRYRNMWEYFFKDSHGIVFVADSSDTDRLSTARDELHLMLKYESLRGKPLLVLANKQDVSVNSGDIKLPKSHSEKPNVRKKKKRKRKSERGRNNNEDEDEGENEEEEGEVDTKRNKEVIQISEKHRDEEGEGEEEEGERGETEDQGETLLIPKKKESFSSAVTVAEVRHCLNLEKIQDRSWDIVGCSALDGSGIDEGVKWIVQQASMGFKNSLGQILQSSKKKKNTAQNM